MRYAAHAVGLWCGKPVYKRTLIIAAPSFGAKIGHALPPYF
jgi:hypothetical protein